MNDARPSARSSTGAALPDARYNREQSNQAVSALSAPLAEQVLAGAREAVRFATSPREGTPAPGASRFGGEPDLPDHVAWPTWRPGPDAQPRALTFFAQVDLGVVAGAIDLDLPGSGLLLFFCDFRGVRSGTEDEGDGDAGILGLFQEEHQGSRVLHVPTTGLRRRPTAPGATLLAEALLHPILVTTFPAFEELEDEDYDAYDELGQEYEEHLASFAPPGTHVSGTHQLGGHARAIQRPVAQDVLAAASGASTRAGFHTARWAEVAEQVKAWRLLLQLASDETLGQSWGDVGTVYWAAPAPALSSGNFAEVWFTFQT